MILNGTRSVRSPDIMQSAIYSPVPGDNIIHLDPCPNAKLKDSYGGKGPRIGRLSGVTGRTPARPDMNVPFFKSGNVEAADSTSILIASTVIS